MKTGFRAFFLAFSLLILGGAFMFVYRDERSGSWSISTAPNDQNSAILSGMSGQNWKGEEYYSAVGVASGTQNWRRLWPASHQNTSPELFWSQDGQILAVRERFLDSFEYAAPRKTGCEWTTAFDFSKNQLLNAQNAADLATSKRILALLKAHGGAVEAQFSQGGEFGGWRWQNRAEKSMIGH